MKGDWQHTMYARVATEFGGMSFAFWIPLQKRTRRLGPIAVSQRLGGLGGGGGSQVDCVMLLLIGCLEDVDELYLMKHCTTFHITCSLSDTIITLAKWPVINTANQSRHVTPYSEAYQQYPAPALHSYGSAQSP
jgi:hypothetical protein